jgi:hypothetical protein
VEQLTTKDNLLDKLRAYSETPDDDAIRYKELIKKALMECPQLLYALHEKDLEDELFDKGKNINWNPETHEPYGAWDGYFGANANIRPFLFFPETQTTVRNYLTYQVGFDELLRYKNTQKYNEITFTIFVHGNDSIDALTGLPRHDLIASIIRERFNWSNIFGMQTHEVSSKESVTDSKYIVRTLVFQLTDINGLVGTPYGSNQPSINNYKLRK